MLGIYAGINIEEILAGTNRHDNFFQRCVTSTFAQTIDSTFDLTGTVGNRSQRVGYRKAQVVMAMD